MQVQSRLQNEDPMHGQLGPCAHELLSLRPAVKDPAGCKENPATAAGTDAVKEMNQKKQRAV